MTYSFVKSHSSLIASSIIALINAVTLRGGFDALASRWGAGFFPGARSTDTFDGFFMAEGQGLDLNKVYHIPN